MDVGNIVVVVEYDLCVVVGVDWVIDIGLGVGEVGGMIVVEGMFV